jgi:protoheme IX farnesyltransferase
MTQTLAQSAQPTSAASRLRQYYALTKPRVVQLVVFCAVIGMFVASPGLPDWHAALPATFGIYCVASAAAAFNCLVEKSVDARMARTAWRPTASGQLNDRQTVTFSLVLCTAGSLVLYCMVNPLTMALTLATFFGYAIVYTIVLKPATPQNIVIGGASGAMPPVLGWAAMRDGTGHEAWLMFLIIFLWTPPHFWALALYRVEDYRRARVPMLPVTHGVQYTTLQMLLYAVVLFVAAILPYVSAMSGLVYLVSAVALNTAFVAYTWRLWRHYSDRLARQTFRFSILYLSLLFTALLIDHYWRLGL